MPPPSPIKKTELNTLLPHSGTMSLLEQVESWDERTIRCLAHSHRAPDNPLREGDSLPAHTGIEYAAQAMAIHGTLCERRAGRPRVGYLAVLSKVEWSVECLDTLPGELVVEAEKLMATEGGFSYTFSLSHDGESLLSGQAVVALQPDPRAPDLE